MICYCLNYFILEPGSLLHQGAGYLAALLVLLRVVWGFVGSSHARFSTFHLTPTALKEHIQHLKDREVPVDTGHNPMGWLMVFALMFLFLFQAATGFMLEEIDAFFGNSTVKTLHSLSADIIFICVLLHVTAVVVVTHFGRISLVKPMITGYRSQKNSSEQKNASD